MLRKKEKRYEKWKLLLLGKENFTQHLALLQTKCSTGKSNGNYSSNGNYYREKAYIFIQNERLQLSVIWLKDLEGFKKCEQGQREKSGEAIAKLTMRLILGWAWGGARHWTARALVTVKTLSATLKRAVTQTRERDSYTRYVGSFSLRTSWRAFLPDDALSKVGKNKLPSTQWKWLVCWASWGSGAVQRSTL